MVTSDSPFPAGDTRARSHSFISTAAAYAAVVKASTGQVYGLHFFNTGATPMYGRLYNKATAPAAGDTTLIKYRFTIPGDTAGSGVIIPINAGVDEFPAGIGIRVTGAAPDNDDTALAANAVIGNVIYY